MCSHPPSFILHPKKLWRTTVAVWRISHYCHCVLFWKGFNESAINWRGFSIRVEPVMPVAPQWRILSGSHTEPAITQILFMGLTHTFIWECHIQCYSFHISHTSVRLTYLCNRSIIKEEITGTLATYHGPPWSINNSTIEPQGHDKSSMEGGTYRFG